MRKLLLQTILILLPTIGVGQVGLIQDDDGYTNVRIKPDSKSEVIYMIQDNEVFFYYKENFHPYENVTDWVHVIIPLNKFSIQVTEYSYLEGYIHKSRLLPIEKLDLVEQPEVFLDFQIEKVDTALKKQRNLERYSQNENERLINGFRPYGLEPYLHQSFEVKELGLTTGNEKIKQPKVLVEDLYNMNYKTGSLISTSRNFKTYTKDSVTFIEQDCSDGAGYYKVVWVIENEKIIQRLVGNIY